MENTRKIRTPRKLKLSSGYNPREKTADLVLRPLFHLWGWFLPRSYEEFMHGFVIGLNLQVDETFTPMFFIFWVLEVTAFWILGHAVATIYNRLSKQ